MSRRRGVALAVAAAVVVAAVVVVVGWVRASATDGAARVAQRYVDLIASGDDDALADLVRMTDGGTPALVDAAGLLAGAEERIEVVALGEPEDSGTDRVEVEVRYRLAGEEHTWPLVLGRDDDSWRVVSPMTGSIAWDEPGLGDVDTEIRLGELVVERRPRVSSTGDEGVQPLYPAGYRAEKRIDPYFATAPTPVAVLPGPATAEPTTLVLRATDATRRALAADLAAMADSCATPEAFGRCPFYDVVQASRAGGEPYRPEWWKGFVEPPAMTVDAFADGVAISGRLRYAAPQGVRTVRFAAHGGLRIDRVSRKPSLTLSAADVETVG